MRQNLYHRPRPDALPGSGEAQEVGLAPASKIGALPAQREFLKERVVLVVGLEPSLPHGFLTEALAQSLRDETGQSVVLLRLTPAGAEHPRSDAFTVESLLNSQTSLPANNGTISKIALQIGDGAGVVDSVEAVLARLNRQYDCVVVQAQLHETPLWALLEFAGLGDSIYTLLPPDNDAFHRHDVFASDARLRDRGDVSKIHAVVCLSEIEAQSGLSEFCATHPHVFIHDCPLIHGAANGPAIPMLRCRQDVRRLAREIGHCRLGLALSAGGAKGLAHIGVLQILEEHGIEVDVIAGCSMGAYIAAAWAVGCDGAKLEALARENEKLWGFWRLLDPTFLPRQGFLHGDAVRRRLQNTVGKVHFSDLVRPVRVVATNLDTLDREVFSTGPVAEAVQASCSIPGVVVPVTLGTETYIDGGVSDPLPVDVLKDLKVDRIVAVNAIPPSAFLRCCREKEREHAALSKRRFKLLRNVNQQINYFARGNILDIMMRAVHGGQIRMAEQACAGADLVLRPLAIDAHWHDFNHPGKYIALGRKVALDHLDELKALVRPKSSSHEQPLSHDEMVSLG